MSTIPTLSSLSKIIREIDVQALPIIAFKIKDGVLIAANPIARYGTSLRYTNQERITNVTQNIFFSASGDFTDY